MRPARLSVILTLLLLTPLLGPGAASNPEAAAGTRVLVCGTVVNAVGWPLADIEVRAIGKDTTNLRDTAIVPGEAAPSLATTGADGTFELRLLPGYYEIALRDTLSLTERGGTLYEPVSLELLPRPSDVQPGACADGSDGVLVTEDGTVALDAPSQGFVQATVVDAIAAGAPPLENATVGPGLGMTDANGLVRFACLGTANLSLRFSLPGYLDAYRGAACQAGALLEITVPLWRKPLTLVASVTNTTDVVETMPAHVAANAPDSGEHARMQGATVALVATPSSLQPLATVAGFCSDKEADAAAVATTNDLPPYRCIATTNAAGLATLRLPWTESAEALTLQASASGYSAETISVTFTRAQADAHDQTRVVDILLQRPPVDLSLTVTTLNGAPVQDAFVEFTTDPDDEEPRIYRSATTDAEGIATLNIPTGPYHVRIAGSGYNDRSCFATVGIDASGAGRIDSDSLKPSHCFRLITHGNSAITGVVTDKETSKPIPGIALCQGADDSNCDATDAEGRYHLETSPATTLALRNGTGEVWAFGTAPSGKWPAVDELVDKGTSALNRKKIDVRVLAHKADGTPIANIDANVQQGGTAIVWPTNVTDANGEAVATLPWNRHATLPQFDRDEFTFIVFGHRDVTHYIQASEMLTLLSNSTGEAVSIQMDEEQGVDTAVTVTDLHTGLPLHAALSAEITSKNAPANHVCGPVCSAQTPNPLTLYPEHTYDVCAQVNHYVKACKKPVTPGEPVALELRRTEVDLAFKVTDPHTGLPINRAPIKVVSPSEGGIVCKPTGTNFVCDGATTNTKGETSSGTLSVPWFDEGQLCFVIDAGNRDVVSRSQGAFVLASETNVPFQEARVCPAIPPQSSAAWSLGPLRAPAPALTGTLLGADGEAVEGATVTPASERRIVDDTAVRSFVCAPAQHNSTFAFGDCAGVPAAAGTFSLALPAAGPLQKDHLWTLSAQAPARYTESFVLVSTPPARPVSFEMWPREFEVVVTVKDQHVSTTPGRCGHVQGLPVIVTLTNLDKGEVRPSAEAVAVPKSDGTCEARLVVENWSRQSQPVPLGVAPWPKSTDTFLVEALVSQHAGYALAQLGPRAATASVTMLHVGAGQGGIATFAITGNITDADARAAKGVPGIKVTASRQGGACTGGLERFEAYSDREGKYNVTVACAGTYSLVVEDASKLYTTTSAGDVIVGPDPATADVAVSRVRTGTITLFTYDATGVPKGLNVVYVDLEGVDVTADPERTYSTAGSIVWRGLPWGTYKATYTPPPGYGRVVAPDTLLQTTTATTYAAAFRSG